MLLFFVLLCVSVVNFILSYLGLKGAYSDTGTHAVGGMGVGPDIEFKREIIPELINSSIVSTTFSTVMYPARIFLKKRGEFSIIRLSSE